MKKNGTIGESSHTLSTCMECVEEEENGDGWRPWKRTARALSAATTPPTDLSAASQTNTRRTALSSKISERIDAATESASAMVVMPGSVQRRKRSAVEMRLLLFLLLLSALLVEESLSIARNVANRAVAAAAAAASAADLTATAPVADPCPSFSFLSTSLPPRIPET